MTIFLSLAAVIVALYFLNRTKWAKRTDFDTAGIVLTALLCIAFCLGLMFLGLERSQDRSAISEYHAFVSTLRRARANRELSEMERAAIQVSVSQWNQKIARARYWNGTVFDIWIVDEFAELPEIE